MVWEIASTMPLYAKVGVVLLVVLVGGYWMFQEVTAAKCNCSCCLLECLDCIRDVDHQSHQGRTRLP